MIKKNVSISVVRIISMFMILACHLCNEMGNKIGNVLGQTFNVGVFIFIIISGYLYGKKDIDKPISWIIKRIKKIMIPVWIWVAIVNIIYLIKGTPINAVSVISYIFNLQGWFGATNGLEHLWFLSVIMICYFVTPILNKLKALGSKVMLITIILFAISIVCSYIDIKVGRYIFEINLYIIAYYCSFFEEKLQGISSNRIVCICLIIVSMLARVILKKYIDGTVLYSNIVVLVTQSIIGFSIFELIKHLKLENVNIKLINHFDGISYYMYIVHCIFCVGPVDIIGEWGKEYCIQLIGVITASYVCAVILRAITNYINKTAKI